MVFVFFIAIYVSACSNYLKGNRTRRKLFGATYMTMNNEFYKVVNNQIRMQVEKNGDEMITLDPALDQKKQNEQIKQLVKRKVDAIFLNSVDWKEVESGLKAAKKAKIPVIVIDSQESSLSSLPSIQTLLLSSRLNLKRLHLPFVLMVSLMQVTVRLMPNLSHLQ